MRKRNNKAGRTAQQRRPAAANDDRDITALKLKPEELTPEMAAYFGKCEEKLGFVPNVLKAYAFDMPKLSAFVAMYNDLMLAPSGLSKLEREMIAVAVSAHNRCYYCLVAHGAAVRQLSGDPPLGTVPACAEAGVLGALAGVVGSLMALEVIREIVGFGDGLVGRLLMIDARAMRFETLRYAWDPANPLNGEKPTIRDLSAHR